MLNPRRLNPHLYEINSRVWLRRLREKYDRHLTLGSVPCEEWTRLKRLGFDYVWLMGVWTPSTRGVDVARTYPELQNEYTKALPEWSATDVIGSPYAMYAYELNPELGAGSDLKTLRKTLHDLGLGLILDFIPNHTAVDHPWTLTHPEYFVQASEEEARGNPDLFFKANTVENRRFLAHGKDPYFPPWLDTAQLNFFNPNVWSALVGILGSISEQCDGVRCDMAMLVLNEVFQKNWGRLVEKTSFKKPADEFWRVAIEGVKSKHPDFILIAEAYWGLDKKLLQLGFDYAYDKTLYDYLLQRNVQSTRAHLKAERGYQTRRLRFIENHDESRAALAFGRDGSKAAAAVISTVPGLRFFHDGQLEGRSVKIPVQLARAWSEVDDADMVEYYKKLLRFANDRILHEGEWQLLETRLSLPGDHSYENLLTWMWRLGDLAKIVVINYSNSASQGCILLPIDLSRCEVTLLDEFTSVTRSYAANVVSKHGLHIQLEPNHVHLFTRQMSSTS